MLKLTNSPWTVKLRWQLCYYYVCSLCSLSQNIKHVGSENSPGPSWQMRATNCYAK